MQCKSCVDYGPEVTQASEDICMPSTGESEQLAQLSLKRKLPFSLESLQTELPNKRQTKNLSFELTTAPLNQSYQEEKANVSTVNSTLDASELEDSNSLVAESSSKIRGRQLENCVLETVQSFSSSLQLVVLEDDASSELIQVDGNSMLASQDLDLCTSVSKKQGSKPKTTQIHLKESGMLTELKAIASAASSQVVLRKSGRTLKPIYGKEEKEETLTIGRRKSVKKSTSIEPDEAKSDRDVRYKKVNK